MRQAHTATASPSAVPESQFLVKPLAINLLVKYCRYIASLRSAFMKGRTGGSVWSRKALEG